MQRAADENNTADRIAQFVVNVFHGTRASMAERIMRDGFAPRSVRQQIQAVGVVYDVTVDALIADLEIYNRFAIVDPRPETTFVTGHPVKAGSWADRAPEATWEALWAVYRIRHPEVGWDWNMSNEGHLWVLAQRLDDPPAVLVAEVPLGKLRNRSGSRTAADQFRDAIETDGSKDALKMARWLFAMSPEWLVRPSDLTPRGFVPVPSRVDHDLMLFMSGETKETFVEQLQTDYWGEPGACGDDGDPPWFPFDQVWARLHADRQAVLEELVGVPITSRLAANETAGLQATPST